MPRTALTKTTLPGSYATAAALVTETACDVGNGNSFTLAIGDIVLIRNSGASSRTYTFTSIADRLGRTGDITAASLAAGAMRAFGPLSMEGWLQTDGKFYLTASNAEVLFSILAQP